MAKHSAQLPQYSLNIEHRTRVYKSIEQESEIGPVSLDLGHLLVCTSHLLTPLLTIVTFCWLYKCFFFQFLVSILGPKSRKEGALDREGSVWMQG